MDDKKVGNVDECFREKVNSIVKKKVNVQTAASTFAGLSSLGSPNIDWTQIKTDSTELIGLQRSTDDS